MTLAGRRKCIRSGQGLIRQWPQNLLARGEALFRIGAVAVKVKPRLVTVPAEARASSSLFTKKYGSLVKASRANEPLTPGEQASFELMPAE